MKIQAWKWRKLQKFAYRLGQVLGVLFSITFLAVMAFVVGYAIMSIIMLVVGWFIA